MLEKIFQSYRNQASDCKQITTDKQMNFVKYQHLFFKIVPLIMLFVYLILLVKESIFYDFVLVDAELVYAFPSSTVGERNHIVKQRKFRYRYVLDGEEYVSEGYKYNDLFYRIGQTEKIRVSRKEPFLIRPFSPPLFYIIVYGFIFFYFIHCHLIYKFRKENYENYKLELIEKKKAEELAKRTYKLGNTSIVLPEKIKSVVKLQYGVAILTELDKGSDCPRNIYNYLNDGRLLWQINPSYNNFGVIELAKYIDYKYQFTSLSLNNNFLYTSTCGVYFAIDIGTGRCVSYNFNETQNNNLNPYHNINNKPSVNENIDEEESLYEFSALKELTDYWKEKEELDKQLREERKREPLWWKLMPYIVTLGLMTIKAANSLP